MGIQQTDHKGKIEQVYSTNGDTSGEQRQNVGAAFASGCKTVLFGSMESNLLVWDKAKGEVICGLDHGECEWTIFPTARERKLTVRLSFSRTSASSCREYRDCRASTLLTICLQCFDRGLQASIVTGTKRGILSWWKPPLTES